MKTILIVEDVELNIDLMTQLLEDDYQLLVARDGAQGVTMALENKPDLILMDVSLPVMDGLQATKKIRAANAAMPIIGLSAHAMQGDADRAKELTDEESKKLRATVAFVMKKQGFDSQKLMQELNEAMLTPRS